MSGKLRAIDIANFYIQLSNSIEDKSIDNLKLNKMLYYAQGHFLARYHRKLFDDEIQAWDYGPVVYDVYHAFKCCGSHPIEYASEDFDESRLSADELEVLTDVYNMYGKYTGLHLKEMTHQKGSPWEKNYEKGKNNIIPTDEIEVFFEKIPIEEFHLNPTEDTIISAVPASWDGGEDSVYG